MTLSSRTRSRAAALATVLATGLGLSLLSAAPAAADEYRHVDATGDVRGLTIDRDSQDPPFSARTMERAADITELRVRHGGGRLILRLETVDLVRRTQSEIGPYFVVRTPNRRYQVQVTADTDRASTTRTVDLRTGRFYRKVKCRGLFTDFDFAGDVAMVSIPRSCIGDPQNVRIKAAMIKFAQEGRGRRFSINLVADSAMKDGRLIPLGSTDAIPSGRMKAV